MPESTQDLPAAACAAQRVTPADIEAAIASEHYFTAADGVVGSDFITLAQMSASPACLARLTFCVLVLRNGAQIAGVNYGAIDSAQHDAERGKTEARNDATRQVWPLLGYALRDKLRAEELIEERFQTSL